MTKKMYLEVHLDDPIYCNGCPACAVACLAIAPMRYLNGLNLGKDFQAYKRPEWCPLKEPRKESIP
jgi:hypothetical protein